MPNEYAVIILAVAALLTGGLYLMTRRRRKKKKSAPPVRPAAPVNQTAGVAATWAPPAPARPAPVAPTMVAPPPGAAGGWGAPPPAKPAQPGWGSPASPAVASSPPAGSPTWGAPPAQGSAPAAPPASAAPTWGSPGGAPAPPAGSAPTWGSPAAAPSSPAPSRAAARARARGGPTGVSDRALVESARGSLVGRRAACSSRARGTSPGTPRLNRLGGAAGVRRRAAGDRGAVVGHSQDRGTGGPARPFVGSASATATCLGRAFGARPCAVPATGRSPATATERRPGARLVGSRRG